MNANWSDYEKYLKPVHLGGKERTLTITRITEEETHPRPSETAKAPVLWFKEVPFGLIISPTNRQTLIALYGDSVSGCVGKPITVKAIDVKVAGKDKQPIRIQRKRPNSPSVEPSTGEIVEYSVEPKETPAMVTTTTPEPLPQTFPAETGSDLDAHFGTRQPAVDLSWPTNEAEFSAWLTFNGWNGKETREALGMDAKSWIKKQSGRTWTDVAKQVQAAQRGL